MRKLFVAILAFVYISTSTGAILHMHYCMGKMVDWGLSHNRSKTCGGCGMKKSAQKDNGCCRDEHKFIKNGTDQKVAETGIQMVQVLAAALPVAFIEIRSGGFPSVREGNPDSHAPPRSCGVAVYIRNCVYLI